MALTVVELILVHPLGDQTDITALMFRVPSQPGPICPLLGCFVQIIIRVLFLTVVIDEGVVLVPPVRH